uniref:Uncharacterized protein n=1 Tax=Daphnia galeata TaxID=27404 RepID=A0A8J2RJ74_9CRUS|nr:unnamed protein product [Daphnia galeata]
MSSPNSVSLSENSSKKTEDSRVASKQETNTFPEEGVKNNTTVAKTEQPAQPPVTNGALPESEVKVVGNGLESSTNGQDEKPISDGPHREVPALLPLGPITPTPATAQQGSLPSVSPTPPARQPLPQLLPMTTATSPVVATKSAPPPPPSNPTTKTRGRTSLPASASPSPSKEQSPPGPSLRSKKEDEEKEQLVVVPEEKEVKKRKVVSKKRYSVASSDSTEKGDVDSGGDGDTGRKSKRARTRTQPFQSSDMDVNLLRVIKASAAAQAAAAAQLAKANEEKLVVFFKGEFLAVRNAEGGFYICQATQNICRGGHKIRIRWLSQEDPKNPKKKAKNAVTTETAKDESGFDIYTPDFYDNTDFECILTNLELEKFGRDRYGLPIDERTRTENILRRAIEVEQGVVDKLELTEEHPDGLDVSLFHDESQLKRKGNDDDSSSESESDSKEEVATTSGSSAKSSQSVEPKTSTSGVASTSSGRGTKRTRAAAIAAARQKIQMRQYQEDDDDDEDSSDDGDDDDIDDDDSSSDSEPGKRGRRGRSRPVPVTKARASVRSARGKKLVVPPKKAAPIPMIMKRTKASFKEATEVTSNRRKVERVTVAPSSPPEKVLTVDVEMAETSANDEESKEIKLDAVMAEENDSTEEKEKAKKSDAKQEIKVADVKSEVVPVEVKPESKDNDKDDVKDVKKQVSAKTEKDAIETESVKEKTEKTVEVVKVEVKVAETKD